MRRSVCPFCYERIDASRLWFQCAGKGTPSSLGCGPTFDHIRERLTGFAEQTRPVFAPQRRWFRRARTADCPTCGGATGRRACPSCHTPLPGNFGDTISPFIAMVGAKGTGKTVYLTVLAGELRSVLAERFGVDVRLAGEQGGFRSSWDWMQRNVEQIFSKGQLSPATPQAVGGRRETLIFEWRIRKRRLGTDTFPTTHLTFCDTAGEDLNSQQATHDLRYLGAADALILLLDPFMLPGAQERLGLPPNAIISTEATINVLSRVTESLRSSHALRPDQLISLPIAVAFAKMDEFFDDPNVEQIRNMTPFSGPAYDDEAGQLIHENMRALLEDWNGTDIYRHLSVNYRSFRFFFVSALGRPPDYATATIQGTVTPYRVDEPLIWLLSRFKLVTAQGRR